MPTKLEAAQKLIDDLTKPHDLGVGTKAWFDLSAKTVRITDNDDGITLDKQRRKALLAFLLKIEDAEKEEQPQGEVIRHFIRSHENEWEKNGPAKIDPRKFPGLNGPMLEHSSVGGITREGKLIHNQMLEALKKHGPEMFGGTRSGETPDHEVSTGHGNATV